MKYCKIYYRIINNALIRGFKSKRHKIGTIDGGYVEVHHILPRCIGGADDFYNLVVLTPKEHFICHYLLIKMFPQCSKLRVAFHFMISRTKGKNCKSYEKERQWYSQYKKKLMSNKDYWSEEQLENLRQHGLRLSRDAGYLKKVSDGVKLAYETTDLRNRMSEITKKRMKDANLRNKISKKCSDNYNNHPEKRMEMSNIIKIQNKNNPSLKQKRINAIMKHAKSKSQEWKLKSSVIQKKRMNSPEEKEKSRQRIKGSNFDTSRKVIDIVTKLVYPTAVEAARLNNINLSTLKKHMYNNSLKFNLIWLDVYQKGENNE